MISQLRQSIVITVIMTFVISSLHLPEAQAQGLPWMPTPGVRVELSPEFVPAHIQGMIIHPDNALRFDFLIHQGDTPLNEIQKKEEYQKLVQYFMASLTVPDDNQWVNLSPYEKNRIVEKDFGTTEMGRDLLAQDYLLKQMASSLMYPEESLGKKFWNRVFERAQQELGTSNIPVSTINKVWIVPGKATLYEKGNTVYVLENHLKVMMEEDYLALEKNSIKGNNVATLPSINPSHDISSKVVREIIIPELEKEVNEGKNFAPLRQVYSSMLLAAWYKRALKESLLGKVYANRAKVNGVNPNDPKVNNEIYQQYLKAFKKGVFNYIKEDVDKLSNQPLPRKYFSGGTEGYVRFEKDVSMVGQVPADFAATAQENLQKADRVTVEVAIGRSRINFQHLRTQMPNGSNNFQRIRTMTVPGATKDDEAMISSIPVTTPDGKAVLTVEALDQLNGQVDFQKDLTVLLRPFKRSPQLTARNVVVFILSYLENHENLSPAFKTALEGALRGFAMSAMGIGEWGGNVKHETRKIVNLIHHTSKVIGKHNTTAMQLADAVWALMKYQFPEGLILDSNDSFVLSLADQLRFFANSEASSSQQNTKDALLLIAEKVENFGRAYHTEVELGLSSQASTPTKLASLWSKVKAKLRIGADTNAERVIPKIIPLLSKLKASTSDRDVERGSWGVLAVVVIAALVVFVIPYKRNQSKGKTSAEIPGLVIDTETVVRSFPDDMLNGELIRVSALIGEFNRKGDSGNADLMKEVLRYLEEEINRRVQQKINSPSNLESNPAPTNHLGQVPSPTTTVATYDTYGNLKGGIDLNPANADIQIKRDGNGVPLPLSQQNMDMLMKVDRFVPVIIEIKPVVNLPIFSQLKSQLSGEDSVKMGAT